MIGKDIPFPMLSDQGGKIGTLYGVYDEVGGTETRGRFIIDPDGVIQAFEVLTPPVGRNVSARSRDKRRRSNTKRLETRQEDSQTGYRSSR